MDYCTQPGTAGKGPPDFFEETQQLLKPNSHHEKSCLRLKRLARKRFLTIYKHGFFDATKPYTSKGKYRKPTKYSSQVKTKKDYDKLRRQKETAILLTKQVFAKIFISYKQ